MIIQMCKYPAEIFWTRSRSRFLSHQSLHDGICIGGIPSAHALYQTGTPLNRIGLIERSYGLRLASRSPTGDVNANEFQEKNSHVFLVWRWYLIFLKELWMELKRVCTVISCWVGIVLGIIPKDGRKIIGLIF